MAKLPQIKYDTSLKGGEREEALLTELDNLLHLEAVAWSRRRRSQTVDESDFEHGFRELVGGRKVDFARQLISAVLYVLSGGGASWAVNAYTSSEVPNSQGHWAAVTMLACGGLAAFVQHWRGWN
ncbi:MAG TPA: hypothetical protein VNH11_05220 [Pirellulales bacterium]|nr:hypothetical protein [Pirellulales bacterium]